MYAGPGFIIMVFQKTTGVEQFAHDFFVEQLFAGQPAPKDLIILLAQQSPQVAPYFSNGMLSAFAVNGLLPIHQRMLCCQSSQPHQRSNQPAAGLYESAQCFRFNQVSVYSPIENLLQRLTPLGIRVTLPVNEADVGQNKVFRASSRLVADMLPPELGGGYRAFFSITLSRSRKRS